jgi:hypothetical protein
LEQVSDTLTEEFRVPTIVLNASLSLERVSTMLASKLRPHTTARASLLLSPRPLLPAAAAKLLARGAVFPSQFGHWCPVDVAAGSALQPILQVWGVGVDKFLSKEGLKTNNSKKSFFLFLCSRGSRLRVGRTCFTFAAAPTAPNFWPTPTGFSRRRRRHPLYPWPSPSLAPMAPEKQPSRKASLPGWCFFCE